MRILIIKPSSFGDIVHGLQVVDSMRRQLEEQGVKVEIDWVIRDIFADLLKQSPIVNRYFVFDRKGGILSFIKLIRQIRQTTYDHVLDMQGLARSALLTFFARVCKKGPTRKPFLFAQKERVSAPSQTKTNLLNFDASHQNLKDEKFFEGRSGGKLFCQKKFPSEISKKIGRSDSREAAFLAYDSRVELPEGGKNSHALDILRKFLPALGLREEIYWPLCFRESEWKYNFRPNRYLLLFPNSRRPEKEWPYFQELTQTLIDRTDYDIVWVGNAVKEKKSFPGNRLHNLIGKTRLDELPSLIKNAECIVSNDSGPMHLAAALQKKTVALFGPTPVARFGPYPIQSERFCTLQGAQNIIENISVESVFKAISD